ncbi:hypothetical protein [uncultured Nostoc sp.]|uniref:hypothetical protein n=1 Tax=uncultured Nostoc sp. TaxID=340711 RepID=UPI0035C965AF
MPCTVLYHPLALNPSALDIRHQLIKILVEWQIKSKNTHVLGIWDLGLGGLMQLAHISFVGQQSTEWL